jgi:RNA polymerase sigma factor (sigma-70 family)
LNIDLLYDKTIGGDRLAEEELFVALSERFEQFAYHRIWDKEDAKDVVQDALSVIAKEYRSVDIEKSFAAWAHKVLDNRILAYIKANQKRRTRIASALESPDQPDLSASFNPDLRIRLLDCLKKIGRVNRRHARIIDLHYHGFSTEEISGKLRLSRNGLYVLLHRARRMLERCLETGDVE